MIGRDILLRRVVRRNVCYQTRVSAELLVSVFRGSGRRLDMNKDY
jgi:hypothetical protein